MAESELWWLGAVIGRFNKDKESQLLPVNQLKVMLTDPTISIVHNNKNMCCGI